MSALLVFTSRTLIRCRSCRGTGYQAWPWCCMDCHGGGLFFMAYASAVRPVRIGESNG
jgi:DnaJ-class molecular chaperone